MNHYKRYSFILALCLPVFFAAEAMEFDLKEVVRLTYNAIKGPKTLNLTIKDNQCPLCQTQFNQDNVTIGCDIGHTFHISCISAWAKEHGTCPIDGEKIKASMLLRNFCRKQEIIRDCFTFCFGALDGAQGYLFYKQTLGEPLSLFIIRSLISTAVEHYDPQLFPQKITHQGQKIVDEQAPLRKYAFTCAASGLAAALIGKQDLFLLQLARPAIRYYGVGLAGSKLLSLACPFDYELAHKLDQRLPEPIALRASGALAGVFLGMLIENILQGTIEQVTNR